MGVIESIGRAVRSGNTAAEVSTILVGRYGLDRTLIDKSSLFRHVKTQALFMNSDEMAINYLMAVSAFLKPGADRDKRLARWTATAKGLQRNGIVRKDLTALKFLEKGPDEIRREAGLGPL